MLKKLIFLTASAVLLYNYAGAQSFTFVRTSDSVVHGPADSTLHSYGTVTNLTSQAFTVQFSVSDLIVPSGWDTLGICTWVLCYGGGYFNISENLPPGPHDMYVYTYPHGFSGITRARVTITYLSQSVSRYFTIQSDPIGIRQISSIVKDFALNQNYPNPFNPNTKISFAIPKKEAVYLRIYDILGREVKTLINEELSAGEYEYDFDAKNMSSGFYYYSLRAGENVSVKKMVLVK